MRASTVLQFLLLFDGLILLVPVVHAFMGAPFSTIDDLFHPEYEPTIPGWYASVKLLILAGLIAALSLSFAAASWGRRTLLGCSLIFLIMSCDESAAIHERVQRVVDNRLLAGTTDHIYDSQVLAKVLLGLVALCVVAIAVVLAAQVLRGIGKGKMMFGIGFVLLVAGAVGADLTPEFLDLSSGGTLFAVTLEELLEMVGVTLMIYGGLQALSRAPVDLHLGARLRAQASLNNQCRRR